MKSQAPPITNADEIRQALGVGQPDQKRIQGWIGGHPVERPAVSIRESLTLFCTQCKIETAGIHADPSDNFRRCPACSSLLGLCLVCQRPVSFRERYNLLRCDCCHNDFITQSTIDDLIRREAGSREIVLSGIRATGELHLGNYFGAMKQFVEFAAGDNLCLYFIADWHTLTTCREPKVIKPNTLRIATAYLAMGLDPNRAIIYGQSSVPEIAELAMYLSMLQNHGALVSLPTVGDLKEKSTEDNPFTLGKASYPVLMAADILGPKATMVPVGPDQAINVRLAIELARAFNNRFRSIFTIPTCRESEIRVPGLGGGKMGKSEENSSVTLLDSVEVMLQKYKQFGVTDENRKTRDIPGDPLKCLSVFPLHKLLLTQNPAELEKVSRECSTAMRGCFDCKRELVARLYEELGPFRERWVKLSEKPDFVRDVLHYGGLKAREIIAPTVAEVRECMGIFPN